MNTKRHKKGTKENKQQHNAKQSKAAKDGSGSGDIGASAVGT
jgi:hypothetical protein